MFDLNLFEFSRHHCIAICAFMVPATLLLTLRTMWLVGRLRPQAEIQQTIIAASFCACILLLHDYTWFMIGVVMVPTYIILTLAGVCLSLNFWAIAHPTSMGKLLRVLIPYWFYEAV